MSWTEPIAAEHANLLLDCWLERMKAPPAMPGSGDQPGTKSTSDEVPATSDGVPATSDATSDASDEDLEELDQEALAAVSSGRWKLGAALGTVLGIGLGLALWAATTGADPGTVESKAPQAAALHFASPISSEPAAHQGMPDPTVPEPVQPAVNASDPAARLPEPASPAFAATGRGSHRGRTIDPQHVSRTRPKTLARQYHRLLGRGWRAYDRGDFPAATNAFSRAVHMWPNRTGGYFGLALSLFEQGAEDGAMQVLERGVRKVGPKSGLWVLAGSIYQFKGKDRPARLAYQRYLHTNPRGRYARDVRVILSYDRLPRLSPFASDADEVVSTGTD